MADGIEDKHAALPHHLSRGTEQLPAGAVVKEASPVKPHNRHRKIGQQRLGLSGICAETKAEGAVQVIEAYIALVI